MDEFLKDYDFEDAYKKLSKLTRWDQDVRLKKAMKDFDEYFKEYLKRTQAIR